MTRRNTTRPGAGSAAVVSVAAWMSLAAGCASEKSADGTATADIAARRRAAAAAVRAEGAPEKRPPAPRRSPAPPATSSKGEAEAKPRPQVDEPGPPLEAAPPRASTPDAEAAGGDATAPPSGAREDAPAAGDPRAVERYLRELQSTPQDAEKAFRSLWEVPAPLIPGLLEEVNNPRPTGIKELSVLVLQTESIARLDESTGSFVYRIRGMGEFYLDDIASGPAPRSKGLRVKITRWDGFPVGVILRAALLNRFRSPDFPPGDDRADLVGWWRKYYERVRAKL